MAALLSTSLADCFRGTFGRRRESCRGKAGPARRQEALGTGACVTAMASEPPLLPVSRRTALQLRRERADSAGGGFGRHGEMEEGAGAIFLRQGSGESFASTAASCSDLCEGSASEFPRSLTPDVGLTQTSSGKSGGVRVRVCSWNLFGQIISEHDSLKRWLDTGSGADVVVIGVQELVQLKPISVLMSSIFGTRGRLATLASRVEKVLNASRCAPDHYVLAGHPAGMVGLGMLVYVRAELMQQVSGFRALRVPTGFGGSLGNKGGVCVSFALGSVSLCFVNTHLPSGEGKALKRNEHMLRILKKVSHGKDCAPSHDFCTVFGDLNSRLIASSKLDARPVALERDEILCGSIPSLTNFQEGKITFQPTFQYIPGTNRFGSARRPAWCDRILVATSLGRQITLMEYDSFMEACHTSDHRPVAAQLTLHPRAASRQRAATGTLLGGRSGGAAAGTTAGGLSCPEGGDETASILASLSGSRRPARAAAAPGGSCMKPDFESASADATSACAVLTL
eukprot:TRINITY_DN21549_c0_g1_i1.p1 TRINITY_DN21549_c0_g1~~TRINITY_DN21549_c0_g1_i1.p1  ORF type:complete len:512 (+),score=103.55 TRINITY_DN21549_c0_g1_i1:139-1674(+)